MDIWIGAGIASLAWAMFIAGLASLGYLRGGRHRHEVEVSRRLTLAYGECEACDDRIKVRLV